MRVVPLELLRALLVPLAVFFGFMLGRSMVRVYRGAQRRSRMYGWLVRTLITVLAASWHYGVDRLIMVLLAALALAIAGGAVAGIAAPQAARRPHPRDLPGVSYRACSTAA